MNRLSFRKTRKYLALPLLVLSLLFVNVSCVPADEAEVIENLFDNVASMGGEMTFVTNDGKVITITVNQESTAAPANEEEACGGDENTDKPENSDKDNCAQLSDYLPTLDCIEDVFKTLGVWEDAEVLRDQGLTWAHIAAELGYDADSMYGALQAIIQNQLHEAKAEGLINQEQYEYKVNLYGEKALKWVNKIFAGEAAENKPELADYLPTLDCVEDVFEMLGVWEDADVLYDQLQNWAHVAAELGYDADSMYAALQAKIEAQLHEAKMLGLITYEQYEYKVGHYSEKALHWVSEIF